MFEASLREIFEGCDRRGVGAVSVADIAEAIRTSVLTAEFFRKLEAPAGSDAASAADAILGESGRTLTRSSIAVQRMGWEEFRDTYMALRPSASVPKAPKPRPAPDLELDAVFASELKSTLLEEWLAQRPEIIYAGMLVISTTKGTNDPRYCTLDEESLSLFQKPLDPVHGRWPQKVLLARDINKVEVLSNSGFLMTAGKPLAFRTASDHEALTWVQHIRQVMPFAAGDLWVDVDADPPSAWEVRESQPRESISARRSTSGSVFGSARGGSITTSLSVPWTPPTSTPPTSSQQARASQGGLLHRASANASAARGSVRRSVSPAPAGAVGPGGWRGVS